MKNYLIGTLVMCILGMFCLSGVASPIEKKVEKISYAKKCDMKTIIFVCADANDLSLSSFLDSPGERFEILNRYKDLELLSGTCYLEALPERPVKHYTPYLNTYKSVYLNHRRSNKAGIHLRQCIKA